MLIRFVKLRFAYEYIVWVFQLTAMNSFAMTVTEIAIHMAFSTAKIKISYQKAALELGFLNCYFLIYMYSLISLFLSSVYICLTKAFVYARDRRIRRALDEYI